MERAILFPNALHKRDGASRAIFQQKNMRAVEKSVAERSLLFCSRRCNALLETFYTSALIENLFLPGKKWVARTTNFHINLWKDGADFKFLAARTSDF